MIFLFTRIIIVDTTITRNTTTTTATTAATAIITTTISPRSNTSAKPTLDKLKFVSGLNLNLNAIVGEKVVGEDSRAVGQIVSAPNTTDISFVYLNSNKFTIGEVVTFKESA